MHVFHGGTDFDEGCADDGCDDGMTRGFLYCPVMLRVARGCSRGMTMPSDHTGGMEP